MVSPAKPTIRQLDFNSSSSELDRELSHIHSEEPYNTNLNNDILFNKEKEHH